MFKLHEKKGETERKREISSNNQDNVDDYLQPVKVNGRGCAIINDKYTGHSQI